MQNIQRRFVEAQDERASFNASFYRRRLCRPACPCFLSSGPAFLGPSMQHPKITPFGRQHRRKNRRPMQCGGRRADLTRRPRDRRSRALSRLSFSGLFQRTYFRGTEWHVEGGLGGRSQALSPLNSQMRRGLAPSTTPLDWPSPPSPTCRLRPPSFAASSIPLTYTPIHTQTQKHPQSPQTSPCPSSTAAGPPLLSWSWPRA